MADYYGKTRTNYFKVKNMTKLEELAKKIGCEISIESDMDERIADKLPDGRFNIKPRKTVVLISDEDMDTFYNEETDESDDTTIEIQNLLSKGEVCIITHVGSETQRYYDAYAYIISEKEIEFVPFFSTLICEKADKVCTNKKNLQLWY